MSACVLDLFLQRICGGNLRGVECLRLGSEIEWLCPCDSGSRALEYGRKARARLLGASTCPAQQPHYEYVSNGSFGLLLTVVCSLLYLCSCYVLKMFADYFSLFLLVDFGFLASLLVFLALLPMPLPIALVLDLHE